MKIKGKRLFNRSVQKSAKSLVFLSCPQAQECWKNGADKIVDGRSKCTCNKIPSPVGLQSSLTQDLRRDCFSLYPSAIL